MKNLYKKIRTPLLLIISGLMTSLPLIITELGFLQWISIIPTAVILIRYASDRSIKLRHLYGMGLLFFGAYYSLAFHWFFYMYPLDFAGLSNAASIAVVLVACFGLGFFQAVQSAFVFLIFGVLTRSKIEERYLIIKPFCAASLWVIFEWWQTFGWWGVPWARLPLGQIDATLLVRSSEIFGSYFVTFTIVAVNFFIATAINEKKYIKLASVVALSLFSLNLTLGIAVTLSYSEGGEKVAVAAAQGNMSSNEKWSNDGSESAIQIYSKLTEDAANEGAKIVVWPETALPYVLFEYEDMRDRVSQLAKDNEVTIILSAFTRDDESKEKYNSIIEVKPDGSFGETVYSKQRLVPFGEFVPMREFVTFIFPPLANIGMLEDDLLAGKGSIVIDSEEGKIGCGICFDSIYEKVISDSARNGAEIIVISTNDSWFSDSAALDMHNAQARLRAIESGKYVIRAANTGISSIIDPLGNVNEELGALERGYIVGEVSMIEGNTVYTYIGNLFVYCCMALTVILLFMSIYDLRRTEFIKKT